MNQKVIAYYPGNISEAKNLMNGLIRNGYKIIHFTLTPRRTANYPYALLILITREESDE